MFNNKIYTITDDRSGVSSIWSLDGSKIGTLNTSISDIVGISQKLFNNGLFSGGNVSNGLEAITILNDKIYVSYIDDESIYLIDIDLSQYE
jgi:hypothetical protein